MMGGMTTRKLDGRRRGAGVQHVLPRLPELRATERLPGCAALTGLSSHRAGIADAANLRRPENGLSTFPQHGQNSV
jgi:hypothetical protein